jgi:hypothetical protein
MNKHFLVLLLVILLGLGFATNNFTCWDTSKDWLLDEEMILENVQYPPEQFHMSLSIPQTKTNLLVKSLAFNTPSKHIYPRNFNGIDDGVSTLVQQDDVLMIGRSAHEPENLVRVECKVDKGGSPTKTAKRPRDLSYERGDHDQDNPREQDEDEIEPHKRLKVECEGEKGQDVSWDLYGNPVKSLKRPGEADIYDEKNSHKRSKAEYKEVRDQKVTWDLCGYPIRSLKRPREADINGENQDDADLNKDVGSGDTVSHSDSSSFEEEHENVVIVPMAPLPSGHLTKFEILRFMR